MTNSKRILIVEDDEPFRRMLGKQLRLHEEFVSIEADTGVKALELAKADYFDIIIVDVGLPDMDGREVCWLMRRNGVVAITRAGHPTATRTAPLMAMGTGAATATATGTSRMDVRKPRQGRRPAPLKTSMPFWKKRNLIRKRCGRCGKSRN